jgi:hypothetical protein
VVTRALICNSRRHVFYAGSNRRLTGYRSTSAKAVKAGGILRQAPVARLGEAPQALHDMKGVLAAAPDRRAYAVKPSVVFGQRPSGAADG